MRGRLATGRCGNAVDGEESGLCLVAHGAYYGELLDAVDRRVFRRQMEDPSLAVD